LAKFPLQVVTQLIPAGVLATVPFPLPFKFTVSENTGLEVKLAVTCVLSFNVTLQVAPLPLHPPDHPTKLEPVAGVSVSVTTVPGLKVALQVFPQLIFEGLLVTVPVPLRTTLSVGDALNFATTEVFCINVTSHAPVPLQPPDHPAKKKLATGTAVSATWVPLA
jgi:hypothetical protein